MSRPCPDYTSATLLRHAEAADDAGFVMVSADLCREAAQVIGAVPITATPYACAHITDDGRCVWHTRTWSPACSPKRCAECPAADSTPNAGLVEALVEALEFVAEEHDAGRHDGLPEPCPAHDADTMFAVARAALSRAGERA